MKQFTEEEFKHRVHEIQKVKKIFVDTGLVENISKAFRAYQEVLGGVDIYNDQRMRRNAQRDRAQQRAPGKAIALPFVPRCPECGNELRTRRLCPAGNLYGYSSHWYCSTGDCIWEIYSKEAMPKELKNDRSTDSE